MGPLKWMFLRFYAANLEGRTRNDPARACRDAITQTLTALSVPTVALIAIPLLWIAPETLRRPPSDGLDLLIVGVCIALLGLSWKFRRYERTPTIADNFRSKGARRVTTAIFFLLPMAGIGVLIVIYSLAKWGCCQPNVCPQMAQLLSTMPQLVPRSRPVKGKAG
jgi:hypothetical protein